MTKNAKKTSSSFGTTLFAGVVLVGLYLATHLTNLTALPVFADEAIYIRWSQLIIDDWKQYLFFPLNDGKTPLFMWLMVPFQFLFSDQLYAGRFVSLLVGLAQVGMVGWLISALGGRQKTVWFGMFLTIILPFWYFHHRMALIDGLLTLCLSVTLLSLIKLSHHLTTTTSLKRNPTNIVGWMFETAYNLLTPFTMRWILIGGVSFGLAMWTKIPAILFIPAFYLCTFLPAQLSFKNWVHMGVRVTGVVGIGLFLFVLLKLNPAFGQLFGRGNDFLYSWQEVFLEGKWQHTVISFPTYFSYFMAYCTSFVLVLNIGGLFSPSRRSIHHVLFWGGLSFVAPIALMGIVVFPRYIFPATLFFTISAALALEEFVDRYITNATALWKKGLASVILSLLIAQTITYSSGFILLSLYNPNLTPFVSSDKVQYLHEWSSGHGISESVEYIRDLSQTQTVAVATEGFFGTLPDGILLYFHRRDVSNIYIEGIGQPVRGVPDTFKKRAATFDTTLLVVNSHRLEMPHTNITLIKEFCRPNQAPCLQLWDITALIKAPPQGGLPPSTQTP